jgi:hypothetical protein
MITSNKYTQAGSPLQFGVMKTKFTRFIQDPLESYLSTIINYTLQIPRDIKAVKFFKQTTSASYPTKVRFRNNGTFVSEIQDLSWVDNIAQINITPVLSSIVNFGIEVVEIFSNEDWDFNFDILFNEVSLNTFCIVPGISCTFEIPSSIEKIDPIETPIFFNISNMVIDHPYFVSLSMRQDRTMFADVVGIPPQYETIDRGVDPFLDYTNGPTDPFYGTIVASSVNPLYPVENIYNSEESYRSDVGDTSTTITHNFGVLRKVNNIALVFKKTELTSIPKNITISGIVESGNTIQIKEIINYIPDINNSNPDLVSIPISINQELSTLIIDMSDTDTTDIRLFMLKIALSSKFYNINSYNWSDMKLENT